MQALALPKPDSDQLIQDAEWEEVVDVTNRLSSAIVNFQSKPKRGRGLIVDIEV